MFEWLIISYIQKNVKIGLLSCNEQYKDENFITARNGKKDLLYDNYKKKGIMKGICFKQNKKLAVNSDKTLKIL